MTSCFAPLLRWIVRLWGTGNRQMVLVLDATSLGERWTILTISVVIRSCAIPVAWKVLGGHEKGSWRPHWKGEVECFVGKQSRLTCTLLMHWEAGYEYPWAVLTDLFPAQAEVSWYGMRTWIESGFKDFKRGLWGWHHSKMGNASRVERLWLAMAVAQVWTVSIGCQAEEKERQVSSGESLPAQHIAQRKRKRPEGQPPPRRLSCVVRGRLALVAALFTAEILPCGTLLAEAWPETISAPRKLPKPSHLRERKREQKRRARARQRVAA